METIRTEASIIVENVVEYFQNIESNMMDLDEPWIYTCSAYEEKNAIKSSQPILGNVVERKCTSPDHTIIQIY